MCYLGPQAEKEMHAAKQRIKIIGTGFHVPDKVLTNADLEKMVDTTDEWIVSRSGIKTRHIANHDQATSDICIEAAKKALRNAHLEPTDVDLILTATNTPDTIFPATACYIQHGLKAGNIPAFDLIAGCTGFLYGLIVAEALILQGTAKRVLLIGGETLTKITNWKDRGTCVLFGDGAGAVVLEESRDDSGVLSTYWRADGSLTPLLSLPAGGTRLPASIQTVAENLHYIQMKGNEVFKHAVKRMGEAAEEALKRAGLTKDDIDIFIPHQANMRIIQAGGERLGLPPEKVYTNIDRYGNVSVACIPIAIHELRSHKKLKPGTVMLLDAFGAGFTWAAVAYRW
jgi:3-oxoacyl-[acyl-carrier-protein] synthase-3